MLAYHEGESPVSHIKKYKIVKGDACNTIGEYMEENQETVVSLALFDFDLYEPTKVCLEAIMDRLTRGSIVAFDELSQLDFPGETLAFKRGAGNRKNKLRFPHHRY